jgi:hypothetical protein
MIICISCFAIFIVSTYLLQSNAIWNRREYAVKSKASLESRIIYLVQDGGRIIDNALWAAAAALWVAAAAL